MTLDAGNYTLNVQPQNGAPVTADVTLANGTQQTLVDYGEPDALQLSVVADDNGTIEARPQRSPDLLRCLYRR